MNSNFTAIIPARYASTRFPGKPLALINGIPMILRVWEKVKDVLQDVYIATDHQEIYRVAKNAGANVIMTSSDLGSGTERVAEAASRVITSEEAKRQIIVNIQGDEPLISKNTIHSLCGAFDDSQVDIATLVHRLDDLTDLDNPNRPKVVMDQNCNALYFSRAQIPAITGHAGAQKDHPTFLHIGVYGFRYTVLQKLIHLHPTPLENAERLEQLRWLENGYSIRCMETDYDGFGIDTPEDLEKINRRK